MELVFSVICFCCPYCTVLQYCAWHNLLLWSPVASNEVHKSTNYVSVVCVIWKVDDVTREGCLINSGDTDGEHSSCTHYWLPACLGMLWSSLFWRTSKVLRKCSLVEVSKSEWLRFGFLRHGILLCNKIWIFSYWHTEYVDCHLVPVRNEKRNAQNIHTSSVFGRTFRWADEYRRCIWGNIASPFQSADGKSDGPIKEVQGWRHWRIKSYLFDHSFSFRTNSHLSHSFVKCFVSSIDWKPNSQTFAQLAHLDLGYSSHLCRYDNPWRVVAFSILSAAKEGESSKCIVAVHPG